ncbi:DUF6236 family protein [Amycolatopsis sp. cmx-11-12]|uniref:DUF6236 family protein n=1 Tax=Amycolatopsis sp. cmx-11-12 TaxID=2785795 RepID=UPI0039171EE0
MQVNAIYYPWMHFQDDKWVKLSLLTWDSVARVRARDVDDRDSDLVRQVVNETDLLKTISPSQHDLTAVANTFGDVLDAYGGRISKRHGLNQDNWREDVGSYGAPASNSGFGLAGAPKNLTWVYCGARESKIGDALRNQLVGRRLGLPHGPWLGMNPVLASVYLATLADAIARHNRISPVTDDSRMHKAAGALDRLAELLFEDGPVPALPDPESAFAHVALQAVIKPDRLAEVPVASLIRFRERYTAELTAFRGHIADLADELGEIATVENVEFADAHLKSLYRSKTKPHLDELRRALRGLGVESTTGVLELRLDLGVAAGTVLGGGLAAAGGQAALAGTAAAIAVVPYLAGRFKARQAAITSSPVAYLMAADRRL